MCSARRYWLGVSRDSWNICLARLKRESWEINRPKEPLARTKANKSRSNFSLPPLKTSTGPKILFLRRKKVVQFVQGIDNRDFFMDFLMPWKIVKLVKLGLPCQTLSDRDNYFKNSKRAFMPEFSPNNSGH